MVTRDPSRIQESRYTNQREIDYRIELERYFDESVGTNVEKLQSFAKFVPRQTLTRFLVKHELFKKVLEVHGSIIECGVYMGGGLMTFAQLSAIFEPVNHQRRIIGFDTFEGFGELSAEDSTGKSQHSIPGGLASHAYDDIQEGIRLFDANRSINHIPKVHLVKGDASETVPQYIEDNPHTVISLLYLDMDVYEPTKVAIEQLLPRIIKGGIIAFDELNGFNFPGETLAVLDTIGVSNLKIQRFHFDSGISYAVID